MIAEVYEVSLDVDENVLKLIVVMIVQLCEYTTNDDCKLKWVNSIVCELYLKATHTHTQKIEYNPSVHQ